MSQQRQFKGSVQPFPSSLLPPEQSPRWSPPYQGASPFQQAYMPSQPSSQQPQWSLQAEQVSICRRCGKEPSFLDRFGFDQKMQRCRTCNNQIQQSLRSFRAAFLEATRYATFTENNWITLQRLAAYEHLDMSEALTFIGKDAVALVERIVAGVEAQGNITDEVEQYISHLLRTFLIPHEIAQHIVHRLAKAKLRLNLQLFEGMVRQAEAKGELTDEMERYIYHLQSKLALPTDLVQPMMHRVAYLKQHTNIQRFRHAVAQVEAYQDVTKETEQSILQLQRTLAVPQEIAQPLLRRLAYLKQLTDIRQGELPTISTSLKLESDELCHLETPATYHKVNAKSTTPVSGRLVATSKRLHFLSATRGTTISWNNIMQVEVRLQRGVYLELAKGTGNGLYSVSDPTLVGVVLDTLVQISKRQLVATKTDPSRHIPQDVKNAVWQRDGGKCVQCGATSYLEFDHIIPYTKGGANTVANVQLLCRSCNLKKSDRI